VSGRFACTGAAPAVRAEAKSEIRPAGRFMIDPFAFSSFRHSHFHLSYRSHPRHGRSHVSR
jgi:hypothetical protein